MKMFLLELEKIKAENQVVSIYSDENNIDRWSVGYVVGINQHHYILASVTPLGDYDGYVLKETSSIFRVVTGGEYNDKISQLIKLKNTTFSYSFESEDLLKEILDFSQKNQYIIAVEFYDSGNQDCVGIIEYFDDEICKIKELNDIGKPNGTSLIKLNSITKVGSDDSSYIPLKLLGSKE